MNDLHYHLVQAPDLRAALSDVTDHAMLRAVLREEPCAEVREAVRARLRDLLAPRGAQVALWETP